MNCHLVRDLGLHKLVFMDDILPEGTEVGYYVRGKVSIKWFLLLFDISRMIHCVCVFFSFLFWSKKVVTVYSQRLLEGYIKDSGIYCNCCNSVVRISAYLVH